jgi:hypothetical protein
LAAAAAAAYDSGTEAVPAGADDLTGDGCAAAGDFTDRRDSRADMAAALAGTEVGEAAATDTAAVAVAAVLLAAMGVGGGRVEEDADPDTDAGSLPERAAAANREAAAADGRDDDDVGVIALL